MLKRSGLALSRVVPISTVLDAYHTHIRESLAQLQAGSQVAETACGAIEYALAADWQNGKIPVLVVHSAGGGYDQSLATGRRFRGHPLIAVSRAGYLRTPLDTGQTPAHMADAYAALLDKLKVERVVVGAFSAGGMSAIEFALRHPDRCRALVLGGAITQPPPAYVLNYLAPIATANKSDFVNWLFSSAVHSLFLPLIERDAETRAILQAFQNTNPASLRAPGYKLDIVQMREFRPRLDQIGAPTLLIHGELDFLVPPAHARYAAQAIPNAQLLMLKRGAHDAPVRYPEQVIPALQGFLTSL
jgi:pimeloyl-ACP methyl ester carboxylesterase